MWGGHRDWYLCMSFQLIKLIATLNQICRDSLFKRVRKNVQNMEWKKIKIEENITCLQ